MSAVAAVREGATRFLLWWSGELAAMVPESVMARRKPKPRSEIHVAPDGVTIDRVAGGLGERFHEGRPLEALDEDAWAELGEVVAGTRPRLLLGVPDIYVASLSLPAAARGRLTPAVALQLPQVAPLDPALLVWTAVPGAAQGGRIQVTVAMARAARVEALHALFADHGLPAPAIAAPGPDGPIELVRAGAGSGDAGARANRVAIAAGLLLLATIPFTTVAGAWLLAGMADDRAESLSRQVAPRLAAERRAERDVELRRALAAVYQHPSATATVEALALGTPDTDHLLSAARAPDGSWQASIDSADPEALQAALAKAPLRPAAQAGETLPVDGSSKRMRVEVRGSVQ